MKQTVRIILFLLFLFSSLTGLKAITISDFGSAKDWCDVSMLDRIEGIWEYPEDNTSVLIKKNDAGNSYDIIVVDSPDTRLIPGEKIGYLKPSPDPDKYEMAIFRLKKKNGILTELAKCYAQYNEKDAAILVKGRSLKFNIGSRYLLPAFWRIIRVSVKDPLESLPKGLIRVYPNPQRRQPDYL